jgi:hypothetical protein
MEVRTDIVRLRSGAFLGMAGGLISYIILVSIFLTGNGLSEIGFTFYWYYPFYIIFLMSSVLVFRTLHRSILFLCALLVFHCGLVLAINGSDGLDLMIKQLVNVVFALLVFYYFIKFEQYDFVRIFSRYVTIAKIVAIIGFIQVLLFLVDKGELFLFFFPFESNITFRFQSLTLEPSFIAYTFAPIVFIAIYNVFNRKNIFFNTAWSWIFVLAYLLTISSIAYLGLVLSMLVLYFARTTVNKLIFSGIALTLIGLFGVGLYRFIPEVKMRIDDTVFGISRDITNKAIYKNVNLSTYAMLSNVYVTRYALNESPIIGHGIGSHERIYDISMPDHMKDYYELNKSDANSLALRLLSETGLLGMVLFCLFLLLHYIRKPANPIGIPIWLINNGILIMIILSLVRNGNYTIHGKLLFLLLYYFTYKISASARSNKSIA